MTPDDFLDFQLDMLHEMCPPVEAVGIGGSGGAGNADALSDLDFFLLIPDSDFFNFVATFPAMVRHPWPPAVGRRRGFVPDFGFQVSFLYPNRYLVDYHLNCHGSLRRTPMARKTRITKDLTGVFTRFHQTLPDSGRLSGDEYRVDAASEIVIELLRIRKYAGRDELVPIVHRLERLRLVLLGLVRCLRHDEPYCPHDADKHVARDLGPAMNATIADTFPVFDPAGVVRALRVLYRELGPLIAELGDGPPMGPPFQDMCDKLIAEIEEQLSHST